MFDNLVINPGGLWIGPVKLRAAEKIANGFKPPFDRAYWSEKKAAERGVPVATILHEWNEKGRLSREKGSRVHDFISTFLKGQQVVSDDAPAVLQLNRANETDVEIAAFKNFWSEAEGVLVNDNPKYVEQAVGDEELQVGGICDWLAYDVTIDAYRPVDWKTGNFNTDSPFGPLLSPFDDLANCEWTVYSIQLSIYWLIYQRNTHLNLGTPIIVHLDEHGFHVHEAIDLRERVTDWLRSLTKAVL